MTFNRYGQIRSYICIQWCILKRDFSFNLFIFLQVTHWRNGSFPHNFVDYILSGKNTSQVVLCSSVDSLRRHLTSSHFSLGDIHSKVSSQLSIGFWIHWWSLSRYIISLKVKVLVTRCPTLCDAMDRSPRGSSAHAIFHKNTGMGCHSHIQRIFLIQGLNPGLLHCRQILYHLSYQRSVSKIIIVFFSACVTWKSIKKNFLMSTIWDSVCNRKGRMFDFFISFQNVMIYWHPPKVTNTI